MPWSTEVRITGVPKVTLTPLWIPSIFTAMCPWSWYIATTPSYSPWEARANTVSGGHRAERVDSVPSGAVHRRFHLLGVLHAEQVAGFGMWIEAGNRNLGGVDPHVLQGLLEDPDHLDNAVRLDQGDGLGQADMGGDVNNAQFPRHQHHA